MAFEITLRMFSLRELTVSSIIRVIWDANLSRLDKVCGLSQTGGYHPSGDFKKPKRVCLKLHQTLIFSNKATFKNDCADFDVDLDAPGGV